MCAANSRSTGIQHTLLVTIKPCFSAGASPPSPSSLPTGALLQHTGNVLFVWTPCCVARDVSCDVVSDCLHRGHRISLI